ARAVVHGRRRYRHDDHGRYARRAHRRGETLVRHGAVATGEREFEDGGGDVAALRIDDDRVLRVVEQPWHAARIDANRPARREPAELLTREAQAIGEAVT